MFGLLRLLIVWRLLRLLVPLALSGLLVAALAPGSRALSVRVPRSFSAVERSLTSAFGSEIMRAQRTVTGALLAGRPR